MSLPVSGAPGAASKQQNIAVKLKRKRPSNEHDGPVLMRFPHGPPPHLFDPDLLEDIEFKMYANPEERKSFQRVLVASTPLVSYVGHNYGGTNSFRANANQYAVGLFDPAKSRLKLVPVPHIYRMEQHVAALDALDDEEAKEEAVTISTQQRVLADTFGSKKRQKQLQSRAANQVTVMESTSQVLTHAIGTIQPNQELEEEDDILESIREKVLPAFNAEAANVRDIYPITSFIPQRLLDGGLSGMVKKWGRLVKKGESALQKDFKEETPTTSSSKFIQNRLLALAKQEHRSSEDRDQVLKLLTYLHLMFRFRTGGKNKRRVIGEWESVEEDGPSEGVKEHLLHCFTSLKTLGTGADAVQRAVYDAQSEKKLLCFIAVASVLAANFTLDADQVDAMSQDLKMMTTDMLKFYAEAGCTVSKVRIHLSAPLKLPSLRKRIEKKK